MNGRAEPWADLYPVDVPTRLEVTDASLIDAWQKRVERTPDVTALTYFDAEWSVRQVDNLAMSLAAAFRARGVGRGTRVGIQLQNVPHYPVTMLALWALGAVPVFLNPMYRGRELQHLLHDSGAVGVVAGVDSDSGLRDAAHGTDVKWILSVNPRAWQSRDDPRVFGDNGTNTACDFDAAIKSHPEPAITAEDLRWEDLAFLCYTSGTSGPPKGAEVTHGNVLHVVRGFERWLKLEKDVVLAMAPMFHITGAVVNATLALLGSSTLVMADRFQAEVMRDVIGEREVTFTIGSITAYNALMRVSCRDDLRSLKLAFSGGAPIPPAIVERARREFALDIHNGYGMTETASAVIAVPPGRSAPIHAASGTLSVGVPLPNVDVRVVDVTNRIVGPGEIGELLISGPQVVRGYWENPGATAATMGDGWLRTGDGAIMDEDGWVYLVDRLKDQINVSGYKVWPREVEDALCEHPDVFEAAVVGKTDPYSGERVEAFVTARSTGLQGESLRVFVRERLAAYKVPRVVHVVDALPKTETGKIRRSELRS